MTIVSLPVHAAGITSSTLSLTPDKETYSVGDTVTFTLKLVSLTADRGINAYSGVYEYDNAKLELVKLTGASGWSMDYNTANGKFVADRNDFTGLEDVELCKLVFKAKAESTSGTEVVVKNVELANGGSGSATSESVKSSVKIAASTDSSSSQNKPNNGSANAQTSVINIGIYTAIAVSSFLGIIYVIKKKIA